MSVVLGPVGGWSKHDETLRQRVTAYREQRIAELVLENARLRTQRATLIVGIVLMMALLVLAWR